MVVEKADEVGARNQEAPSKPASSQQQPKASRRSLFSVLFSTSSKANKLQQSQSSEHDDSAANHQDNQENQRQEAAEETDNQSEDLDSYELDLNQRLKRERLKAQEEQKDCDESGAASPAPTNDQVRSETPDEARQWQVHELYIPANRTGAAESKSKPSTKSPLLESFLSSHQIRYESIETTDSDQGSSSSDLSLGASNRQPLVQDAVLNERDLRLNHWRLLASRSAHWGQSPMSSDSELDDQLERESPALVITCSEDTSCSSVELIWSPRAAAAESRSRQQVQGFASKHFEPVRMIDEETSTRDTLNSELSSINQTAGFFQRLSIFELAKPMRAKGKRYGHRRRRRSSHSSSKERSSVEWVANPLFSNGSSDNEESCQDRVLPTGLQRCASCDSAMPSPTATSEIVIDLASAQVELDSDLEAGELQSSPGDDAGDRLDAARRRRLDWSNKSPFKSKRDNIYLNHIMNLDKRIKSNVSSLRNQLSERLSDTSKRASVLADQLITSIKDTTKEQLFSGGRQPRRRESQDSEIMSNTFSASNPSMLGAADADTSAQDDPSMRKAKLFSLIYKHQQLVNGEPVVTQQPTSIGGLSLDRLSLTGSTVGSASTNNQGKHDGPAKTAEETPVVPRVDATLKPLETGPTTDSPDQPADDTSSIQVTSVTSKPIQEATKKEPVAGDDQEEPGEFYEQEYNKFKSLLEAHEDSSSSSNSTKSSPKSIRRQAHLRRSLNYWRRFKAKRLDNNQYGRFSLRLRSPNKPTDLSANQQRQQQPVKNDDKQQKIDGTS